MSQRKPDRIENGDLLVAERNQRGLSIRNLVREMERQGFQVGKDSISKAEQGKGIEFTKLGELCTYLRLTFKRVRHENGELRAVIKHPDDLPENAVREHIKRVEKTLVMNGVDAETKLQHIAELLFELKELLGEDPPKELRLGSLHIKAEFTESAAELIEALFPVDSNGEHTVPDLTDPNVLESLKQKKNALLERKRQNAIAKADYIARELVDAWVNHPTRQETSIDPTSLADDARGLAHRIAGVYQVEPIDETEICAVVESQMRVDRDAALSVCAGMIMIPGAAKALLGGQLLAGGLSMLAGAAYAGAAAGRMGAHHGDVRSVRARIGMAVWVVLRAESPLANSIK